MVMFLLSFVKGSKSASGYGPGAPYPLADLDRGSNSRESKSARTLVCDRGTKEYMIQHKQYP